MIRAVLLALAFAVTLLPLNAGADALTAIIQKDLTTLGYDTGGTDGEMTVQTAVAVSKFQAENDLEVTGEITPQLAGVIKAAIGKQGQAAPVAKASAAPAAAAPAAQLDPAQAAQMQAQMAAMMQAAQAQGAGMDPAAMQAMMQAGMDPATLEAMQAQAEATQQQQAQSAQQACLQQKIADAQAAQEAAKKKRGFGSLMRGISRLGGDKIASTITGATSEIAQTAGAISDLESAAKDLGLTEEDVASCQGAQ